MAHWFSSFTAACCLAATIAPASLARAQPGRPPAQGEIDAEQVWRRTLAALEAHASVECKLYQEVRTYDQHLLGHGTYLQGPPGYRWSSLELAVKVDQFDAIVKQRCDGERLWIFRSTDGLPRLSCVDVKRVLAAARAAGREGSPVPGLGIGGLPKLFDSLDKGFRFTDVRSLKIENQPVFLLKGEWENDRLVRWLPGQKEAIESGGKVDLTKLPPPIPDHVLIYVGAADLFPRRIEYRRTATSKEGPREQTLLLLSFSKITFNKPVERRSFGFDPGPLPIADETEAYIRSLGLIPVPEAALIAPSAARPTR